MQVSDYTHAHILLGLMASMAFITVMTMGRAQKCGQQASVCEDNKGIFTLGGTKL